MKKIDKIQTVLRFFFEIWYVDASQQKKCFKILFWILAFFDSLFTKKQSKLTKNEENWRPKLTKN